MKLTDTSPRVQKPVLFADLAAPCYFLWDGALYFFDGVRAYQITREGVAISGPPLPHRNVTPVTLAEIKYK